jgi:hypothetical protein
MASLQIPRRPDRRARRFAACAVAAGALVAAGFLAHGTLSVVLFALAALAALIGGGVVWTNWPGYAWAGRRRQAWRIRRYGRLIPRQGTIEDGFWWDCPWCGREGVLNRDTCPDCGAIRDGERARSAG